jgi:GNAT superfamily N-acetyltransferase
MKIVVSTESKDWTDFEKNAWAEADKEHYGREINWDKKDFHITLSEKDILIGSLRLTIRAGVAYIDAVVVDSKFRGKGLGSQLITEAERIAKETKAHKIYLQTGKRWSTVSLYEKLGYQKSSKLPNHYVHADFVEMTKFL